MELFQNVQTNTQLRRLSTDEIIGLDGNDETTQRQIGGIDIKLDNKDCQAYTERTSEQAAITGNKSKIGRYLQILLQLDKRQGKILETQYNNRKIYFTKIMTDVTHPVCLSHSSEEGHGFLGASSSRINTTRLATKARSSDLPIS